MLAHRHSHTTVIQGKRYEHSEKIISKGQDKNQENYVLSTEMKPRILKDKY